MTTNRWLVPSVQRVQTERVPGIRTDSAEEGRAANVLANPHRRWNPLVDEWVLVSTERTRRPWLGRQDPSGRPPDVAYDPTCYLCPTNTRANGLINPAYDRTFVFTNDYAALRPEVDAERIDDGLLRAEGEPGTCRVLCFSPRHDVTLALMSRPAVRTVIDVWADQTAELGKAYQWVQVFENRGETMGASNPHPHGQIWAGTALPHQAARENASQRAYYDAHGSRLLLDYTTQEHLGPRVVVEDDDWLVVVPFWAVWPFETLVIPKHPVERLPDLTGPARDSLAGTLIELLARYDNLFRLPFPYSMGWHQAPFDGQPNEHWQLHGHLYPPLQRAAVRKFIAGYEMFAETQRDLSAEEAAERLRTVAPVHYLSSPVPSAD
jgi:UDPglucose--hexose-1-phosphate uridylyltransferase